MKVKIILVSFFAILYGGFAYGQNPKFDKLEMLFDQGHYKRVHRKADRLLDNPEYDYSQLPKYYKSLSLFQLSQNEYWLSRHTDALDNAKNLFTEVRDSDDSQDLFLAHMLVLARRDLE